MKKYLFLLAGLGSIAAQALPTSITIPNGTQPIGSYSFGEASVKGGITVIEASLDRTNWTNPVSRLEAKLEMSKDSGKTWEEICRVTSNGGALLLPVGVLVAPPTKLTCNLPNPELSSRRIRGEFVISGGSISTGGTVITR